MQTLHIKMKVPSRKKLVSKNVRKGLKQVADIQLSAPLHP